MQETQVRSLGREDPLEEGTATHSSVLAWRIPRTEEGHRSWGRRVGHDGATEQQQTMPHEQGPRGLLAALPLVGMSGMLGKPSGLYMVCVFPGSELVLIQGK